MPGNPAYLAGLDRNQANYTPPNPVARAAHLYPDRIAIIQGDRPAA